MNGITYDLVGPDIVASSPLMGVGRCAVRDAARVAGFDADEQDEIVDYLGAWSADEVGLFKKFRRRAKRRLKKMGRRLKKAAKKTVRVAKKIAKNKMVRAAYNYAKKNAPPPANIYLMAAEKAVGLGKALKSAARPVRAKAKKARRLARRLARGKVTAKTARRAAKAMGVKPDVVVASAAVLKGLQTGSKPAIAAARLARGIEARAAAGDLASVQAIGLEAKLRGQYPGARSFRTQGPSGRVYQSVVVPVS